MISIVSRIQTRRILPAQRSRAEHFVSQFLRDAELLAGLSRVSNERARPQRHYRRRVVYLVYRMKDSTDSIASSTIPVYRPILNGRPNTKWIQTGANRAAGSYESPRRKPRSNLVTNDVPLNQEPESQSFYDFSSILTARMRISIGKREQRQRKSRDRGRVK